MTDIFLHIEGCDPIADTVDSYFLSDKSLTADQKERIKFHLGYGITTSFGGGPTPAVIIVNLNHRDSGFNAGSVLDVDGMTQLFKVYAERFGLPDGDAYEALAQLSEASSYSETLTPETLNWLSGFIEGWDEAMERETMEKRNQNIG